ncbi:MAG: aminodeoxychorismate/anthranilate synthase component II [bacterium]|nr:aminodeoxychorismate/anthranilate synthase component II [Gammaproteobacteria bacterium]HIL97283.1 aminodeoxychorismate/anthranilate synthase component II [Pseudomonadales bacterium]
MILMIDNYDSFTYNLVQYLGELGEEVSVFRNDEITIKEIASLAPAAIVLSPGPCTPNEAGISMQVVRNFAGKLPLLGICLGHQSIAQELGGDIIRARQVMHGKTSDIYHNSEGVFKGLPNPFTATRYHSLIVDETTLPESLEVTAWTEVDGKRDEIMAIRQCDQSLEGVQFHPESILTEHGHALLSNFLQYK